MRTALIDADVVAYQYAAAAQRSFEWDAGEVTRVSDSLEECLDESRRAVERLRRKVKADDVIVCFTDQARNWRKDVLPTYKANRAGVVKPEQLFPLRDALAAEYRCYTRPGLEGDDVMGILATHPKLIPGVKVIVSIDKDMGQIPGFWYNPGRDEMRVVTPEEGERLHWMQMLTGDPVDGYKGCPGVGPVAAEKIVSRTDVPLWTAVVEAYITKGLTPQDALAQARVAKILQWTDYDYKRKEPILWTPPS